MKIKTEEMIIAQTDDDGFIVKTVSPNHSEEGKYLGSTTCVEVISDVEGDEKAVITNLLNKVADWCGYNYDKFSKENLNITWDKVGHKVEVEKK